MTSPHRMNPGEAAEFRQQFFATLDQFWANDWSQREAEAERRWFAAAWRDTRRILERARPAAEEPLGAYVLRVRDQLKVLEWRYLFGDQDDDGYMDVLNCYARGMHTIVRAWNRMGLGLREREFQA